MKRRDLLKTMALSMVIPQIVKGGETAVREKDSIKPRCLSEGDKVGIVAPATAANDPDEIKRAEEVVKYFGLIPVFGKTLRSAEGYKTKSVQARADDINEMFANSEIKAVLPIRGGYGSAKILNSLDYKVIADNPKIFCGYSDITAMHLAIHKMTGMICMHGPVLLSDFTPFSEDYYKKAIFSKNPIGEVKNSSTKSGIREQNATRTIVPGKAKGKLIGGNLSLVSALMGTQYEPDFNGKIVFLEDVGEEPYSIDRMLTQLRIGDKLDQAAAVVIGRCKDCVQKSAPAVWDGALGDVLDANLSDLKIPVFYGLNIGHTSDQATLPIGVEAELNSELGVITITESACQ